MAILKIWSKFVRLGRNADALIINVDHVECIETKQREGSSCSDMTFYMRSGAFVYVHVSDEELTLILEAPARAGHTETME